MAVNSLLYLLFTTGLTTPPDQSVTTESAWEYTREFPVGYTEDAVQQTKWPGYSVRAQAGRELEYSTENPSYLHETRGWRYMINTEEPQLEKETREYWGLATEEPEHETQRPESRPHKKGRRTCPAREHFSKCHKNCEKTCSDFKQRRPCPRSCKKGCVCDGGLVRNKEGKCVPRDKCPKTLMGEDDNSHGCPYEYACDVHCVTKGLKSGHCEGNTCICSDQ